MSSLLGQPAQADALVEDDQTRKSLLEAGEKLAVALPVERPHERLALGEPLALERGDDRLRARLVGLELIEQLVEVLDEHVEVANRAGDTPEPAELPVEGRELVADQRTCRADQGARTPDRDPEAMQVLRVCVVEHPGFRPLEHAQLPLQKLAQGLNWRHPAHPRLRS